MYRGAVGCSTEVPGRLTTKGLGRGLLTFVTAANQIKSRQYPWWTNF
jgi:hypothetical protein